MPVLTKPQGKGEVRVLCEFLLNKFTQDELRKLHRDVVKTSCAVRKSDLAESLSKFLLGTGLNDLFQCLSDIDKLAVGEALHSPHGYVPERFAAIHGRKASLADGSSYFETPKILRLFTSYQSGGSYKVPLPLQQPLRAFVPVPKQVELKTTEELPATFDRTTRSYALQKDDPGRTVLMRKSLSVMPTREPKVEISTESFKIEVADRSEAAQSELFAFLRLIQQGKVVVSEKTHLPSVDMMWKISRVIDEDYFQNLDQEKFGEIGFIRPFAWTMIAQSAGLAKVDGKKLSLTKAGTDAFSKKPASVLRTLWEAWEDAPFDEFTRVDFIKGQSGKGKRGMEYPPTRRAQIVKTLLDCPAGSWIRFEDFSKYMRACGNSFEVTYDPWKLYMGDSNYGALGYDDRSCWEILQDRYLLCFLFEYAATLGLIDIAFVEPELGCRNFKTFWGFDEYPYLSRYDGLLYFRVNSLGAYCLGNADSFASSANSKNLKISVMPNMRINLVAGDLSAQQAILLDAFAETIGDNVWEISQTKCLESCEAGMQISDFRELLASHDDQPLPDIIESFLAKIENQSDALLPVGKATIFFCSDRKIAQKIAAHHMTKKLCQITNQDMLVVKTTEEEKFRKAIRILGFGAGS